MSPLLKRARCQPRPAARTSLRLALLLAAVACLFLTVEGFSTEWLMRHAFSSYLGSQAKRILGSRMDALTGQTSLYELLQRQVAGEGGDAFDLVALARREMGSDDPDVAKIILVERKIRRADRALAYLALSGAVTFALLAFVVYGAAPSKLPGAATVHAFFNRGVVEAAVTHEGPRVPTVLGQVLLDWVTAESTSSGSLFVDLDTDEMAQLCSPTARVNDERLYEALSAELLALARVPHRLTMRRKDWELCWEGIPLVPARAVTPPQRGAYRLETNLHSLLVGKTLHRPLAHEAYALPLLAGPIIYELWKVIWDERTSGADGGTPLGEVKISLCRLCREAGLLFRREQQLATLRRLHAGLDELRHHGFIEGWTVSEGGRTAPQSWYERVSLFHYDRERAAYILDRQLLERKIYHFWCAGARKEPQVPKGPPKKPRPWKTVSAASTSRPTAAEPRAVPSRKMKESRRAKAPRKTVQHATAPEAAPPASRPPEAAPPIVFIDEHEPAETGGVSSTEPIFIDDHEAVEKVQLSEHPVAKPSESCHRRDSSVPAEPLRRTDYSVVLCRDETSLVAAALQYVDNGFQSAEAVRADDDGSDGAPADMAARDGQAASSSVVRRRPMGGSRPRRFDRYRRRDVLGRSTGRMSSSRRWLNVRQRRRGTHSRRSRRDRP